MNLDKSYTANDLKSLLQGTDARFFGDTDAVFNNIASFFKAQEQSLTFLDKPYKTYLNQLPTHPATVIICPSSWDMPLFKGKCVIQVEDPKLTFSKLIKKLLHPVLVSDIHPTAIIEDDVKLGQNIYIGPYTIIQKGCEIGDNSRIESHCFLFKGTVVGKNVCIESGTKIGKEGFGFIPDENGININFPHIGNVIIHDEVEIGSNTVIDRGTLNSTVIGKHTKIDDLVHIAHNAEIGENVLICSHSTVSGSCKIGDNVYIGTGVTVRDNIVVGGGAKLSLGSTVVKDVPENTTVTGYFAVPHQDFLFKFKQDFLGKQHGK
jgi:UDP-3-O-[3-hydroxymyristoyl] glucosamine N-acyltransferase